LEALSSAASSSFSCYYCNYETHNEEEYKTHVVLKHNQPAYPNKAEIEKRGLKPQGKDWEEGGSF
jgi:hypothetical protein